MVTILVLGSYNILMRKDIEVLLGNENFIYDFNTG